MNLLAIDTSTKTCNVALFKNGKLCVEITKISNETHSKHLLTLIEETLKIGNSDINDIDYFAVTKGPGSFTGLRIGISTIKGLAFHKDKKVITVSSLHALAFLYSTEKLICPIIDARKNELYFALYKYKNNILEQIEKEQVLPYDKICEKIKEPCVFVGAEENYKNLIKEKLKNNAFFAEDGFNTIRAFSVGKIAINKIKKRKTESAENIVPYYIRKSDAENKTVVQSFQIEWLFKGLKKNVRKLL